MTEIAEAGHNQPPPLTPLEAARELLADLTMESETWLDGEEIKNQAQADDVARLIDAGRKAKQRFDADRKAEKKPHDEAAKAVDASWKPVIADADRIVEIGKAAVTPWLIKMDEEKRKLEEATRRVAEEAAEKARKAAQESDGSLAAAKARDRLLEDAKQAERVAILAANESVGAKGEGMARKTALRTTYIATVTDRRAFLNHIAKTAPDDLSAWLDDVAQRAVRHGARELPGVEIREERAAA